MVENDIYRGSCAVLFQAILTQACRTVLAICFLERHKVSDARVVAMANAYVSASEASSLIEGMNMHTLLTALHLMCCEHHPHRACHHCNGELAAAVDAIRRNSEICLVIQTALTNFIFRKWKSHGDLLHRLVQCAKLSNSSTEYCITTSLITEEFEAAPLALLLRLYPELGITGAAAEVSCGCPHEWFRKILPAMLLTASMEQHAQVWRRSSLLLSAFLRWRQRHGMRLLSGLAAGTLHSALENSTHAPSTVPIETPVLAAAQHAYSMALEAGVSGDSFPPRKFVQSSGFELEGTLPEVNPRPGNLSREGKLDDTTNTSDPHQGGEMLKSFIEECDKLASMRTKRRSFLLWRDVRFDERCRMKIFLSEGMRRTKQRYWTLWVQRVERRRIATWKVVMAEQCRAWIELKMKMLVQKGFVCWKNSFMVRHFRTHTCGFRYFAIWRRACIFSIHARGKSMPVISHRAVTKWCLEQWRYVYRGCVADRICMKRYFARIRNRLGQRSVFLQCQHVAKLHERRSLQFRYLRIWCDAYRLHRVCAQLAQTTGRSLLHRVITKWHKRCLCRRSGHERVETFLSMRQRRLVILAFICWWRKGHFRKLFRCFAISQIRRTYRAVWIRWRQRTAFHRQLQRDRFALAVFAHQRFLLRNVWLIWRLRCTQREHLWIARHETALLLRAKRVRDRQLLGKAWFTWKGRTHLVRRQHCDAALSVSHEKTLFGINRSFPPVNASTGILPRSHAVHSRGLSVSFAELDRSPPRRDPLAALRVERALLRGLDASQWHSLAHSRFFNTSNDNKKNNHSENKENPHFGRFDIEETTVIMMPSDVEDDFSPSADNSQVLL